MALSIVIIVYYSCIMQEAITTIMYVYIGLNFILFASNTT